MKKYFIMALTALMLQSLGIASPVGAMYKAMSEPNAPLEAAAVVEVKSLNPITLQVKLSEPIPDAELELKQAKSNFQLSNALSIRNFPQLKTGSTATYIVPTTVQQPDTTYTLSYAGGEPVTFIANTRKIPIYKAKQIAYDTFEIESSLEDDVTDYENIVQAYAGYRNGLDFIVDDNNAAGGRSFDVIPSLRDAQLTITPKGGEPLTAVYVRFTQATDGRQGPKFRLAEGQELKPGVKYTVSSDWASIAKPAFKARKIKPLPVLSIQPANETSLTVILKKDPMDELFASRQLKLTGDNGTMIKAQYKVGSREGAACVFELMDGAKLSPGVTYKVAQIGRWANLNAKTVVKI